MSSFGGFGCPRVAPSPAGAFPQEATTVGCLSAGLIEHEVVDVPQDGFVFADEGAAGVREAHELPIRSGKRGGEFFGVFDGHDGVEVSGE